MVRIGLIGDTHYPEAGPLWDEAYERLSGLDLILHAGDLHVIAVLDRSVRTNHRIRPSHSAA